LALSPPRVNNAAGDVEKRTMASGGDEQKPAAEGSVEVETLSRNNRVRAL
jgi:hypothetical protein